MRDPELAQAWDAPWLDLIGSRRRARERGQTGSVGAEPPSVEPSGGDAADRRRRITRTHRPPPASATTTMAPMTGRGELPEPEGPVDVELPAGAAGLAEAAALAEAAGSLATADAVETGDAVALGRDEAVVDALALLETPARDVGFAFTIGVGVGFGVGVGVGFGVGATTSVRSVMKA